MFCPQCGQRQVANDVRFCSSCGFQLNVVSDLLTTGGVLTGRAVAPSAPRKLSPRSKGIRQGAMMMLSTMLIVPLIAIIFVVLMGLPAEIAGIAAISCFVGGLLRIVYAALFEDNYSAEEPGPHAPGYAPPPAVPTFMSPPARGSALPPPSAAQTPSYQPPRRVDTGEVTRRPPSVTENTTRLLGGQPDDTQGQ